MTRWARRSFQNKAEHKASKWQELHKDDDASNSNHSINAEESEIIYKDLRRENRRLKRQRRKECSRVCFHCRVPGHGMADCPKMKDSMENGTGICYKCGSTEHKSQTCTAKLEPGQEFTFSTCFVCGNSGHLSSTCPDNPRRLYPDGGGCKLCGSVEHYKKDCPERKIHNEVNLYRAHTSVAGKHLSVDDELTLYEDVVECKKEPIRKKPKIVKF